MKKHDCFDRIVIPTYEPGESEPLPIFFEKRANQGASSKFYPMNYTDKIGDRITQKSYKTCVLENEYIRVTVLPEIGGKIQSALDKTTNYDFIYHNKVIKPAMIAIAGPWVSGGIEFNWPLHHRPTTFMPMDAVIEEGEDGKTVWMGELEPYNKLKGMVGVSLGKNRSYFKVKVKLFNTSATAQPFLWWANTAVEVNDSYKIVFPQDVEYVHYHDRKGVVSWPIAKGVYNADRQFDYGDGKDIHEYKNNLASGSFMVAKGQSDCDFLCGYDSGKNCGMVTVTNHYISPGKKLWTWGNNPYGYKWEENLTDDGSRYVELMTGCFCDNQPDFSYIAPYECKEFEQFWYPVRDIGEIKNATVDAAVNVEACGNGTRVGFYATGVFEDCKVLISRNGQVLVTDTCDLSPEKTYIRQFEIPCTVGLTAELRDKDNQLLVKYSVYERGKKPRPDPRTPSPRPYEIKTTEELYLHGKHIVQYKHFAYEPDGYFEEGLKRDPGDSRCNEALGDLKAARGQFSEALQYYSAAEKRTELRNANPENTDILYKKGLAERNLGLYAEAYRDLYWAAWSYANKSAAFYALAGISAKSGEKKRAAAELKVCLETNTKNLWAKYMLFELTGEKKYLEEIETQDALFMEFGNNECQALSFANELIRFGLYLRAIEKLEKAEKTVKVCYYLAYLYALVGDSEASEKYKVLGEQGTWERTNFNMTDDIPILEWVNTARSKYYLGCLYYDKLRYADAAKEWEDSLKEAEFAPALRCLAIAYFDKLDKKDRAEELLLRAFALMPDSTRIFMEIMNLNKALNKTVAERRKFLEENFALVRCRDDCLLEYVQLLTVSGEYDKVCEILSSHAFHTYEGGEGNLTSFHAMLFKRIGDQLASEGKHSEAEKAYRKGLVFPKNYGEEKSIFANDAPLYYSLSQCEAISAPERRRYTELGTFTYGAPSVYSYYQVENLRNCGKEQEAAQLIGKMHAIADDLYENRDLPPYFGVGAHMYMPFQYDVEKVNLIKSAQLKGYAYLAEGNKEKAKEEYKKLLALDQGNFTSLLLGKELGE